MEILLCSNKDQWNDWAQKNDASFLQSWEWGDILIAEGKQVERLQVKNDDGIIAQAQVVYSNLPFGWRYGFGAKGPVVDMVSHGDRAIEAIDNLLRQYFENKKCIFFRFEPLSPYRPIALSLKVIDTNPRATTLLDLKKSEDELLGAMHQKTRYNIRLAEKKNLRVVTEKNLQIFLDLMRKTGARDGFKLHDTKHYEKIFASSCSSQITIFDGGVPLATGVFVGFGNTFTYLYGASDHEYRQFMAPYLLQWQGIQMAQKLGYARYDFFGVATRKLKMNNEQLASEYEYDQKHQYAGVTRFKLGFGGVVHEDPGTFDLLISPRKYKMYGLLRKIRRLI